TDPGREDLPERSESAPLGHRSRRRAQRAVARAEIPEHAGPSHHRPAGQADRLTPQPGRETTEKVALDRRPNPITYLTNSSTTPPTPLRRMIGSSINTPFLTRRTSGATHS